MGGGERAVRAAQLLHLTRKITARHDLDDVLAEVFRSLRPLVDFGGGSIQLLDDEGWIRPAAADPAAPEHVMAQRIPLGGSIGGRVILTEQVIYLPDVLATYGEVPKSRSVGEIRSYLGVPLLADGRAIGLLQVDSAEPDAWSEEDQLVFVLAAPVVAAAIQNARAHARVATARTRADTLQARLAEARVVAAAARSSARSGRPLELDTQLGRLEEVLAGTETPQPRMPRQRVPQPAEVARR